jgi:hypothetical protein
MQKLVQLKRIGREFLQWEVAEMLILAAALACFALLKGIWIDVP